MAAPILYLQWIAEEKKQMLSIWTNLPARGTSIILQVWSTIPPTTLSKAISAIVPCCRNLRNAGPMAIVHCAAEIYTGRSPQLPEQFVQKNIIGTFDLFEKRRLSYLEGAG